MCTAAISFMINSDAKSLFLPNLILAIFFILIIVPFTYMAYFKDREIEILYYISLSGIINAIFIIGMFFSTDFQKFYLSLLASTDLTMVKGDLNIHSSLYSMRMLGLTGSATYGMATTQIVLAFIYIYYALTTKGKLSLINSLIFGVILISAILSGRTAFVGIFFITVYLIINLQPTELIKYLIIFSLLILLVLIISKTILPDNFYAFFYNWFTELFTKGIQVGSVQSNLSMYQYSLSDFDLLGDFRWHNNEAKTSYYMNTDVGWYRFLFAFGYSGLFCFMLLTLYLMQIRFIIKLPNATSMFIGLFLIVVMLKGAIFFDFYMSLFILETLRLTSHKTQI